MHTALIDNGYRADPDHPENEGNTRRVYLHCARPLAARLERIGLPHLPVAVTVIDEKTGRAVGMASKPDRLRILLERIA